MNDLIFNQIKSEYDNFYRQLLRKGRLPMWSTSKGFWNAAVTDEVYEAFKKLKLGKFENFLDLGSGDGKVVLLASLFCKNAEGIEIDRFLHNKAVEMQRKFGINNAKFHNKDFFHHNLADYDVLFTAPDASFDRGLEKKLFKEMRGKLIHYGHHFHPKSLKKEDSFLINGTLVSIYSK
jgi:cyclopropane fatty-acyl-phospholipid synthase-like methyltransferase